MIRKLFLYFKTHMMQSTRSKDQQEDSPQPQMQEQAVRSMEGTFEEMWAAKRYMLSYLYLNEIMEHGGNSGQHEHVLIMDGDDSNMLAMVDDFAAKTRYLTIITKRPEWYRQICDRIYQESGMLVELECLPEDELTRLGSRIYIEKTGEKRLVWSSHFPCPGSGVGAQAQ